MSCEDLPLVLPKTENFRDVTLCQWASSFGHLKLTVVPQNRLGPLKMSGEPSAQKTWTINMKLLQAVHIQRWPQSREYKTRADDDSNDTDGRDDNDSLLCLP